VTDDVTPPTVRLARPEDAEAIADAHVRGWRAAYRGLVPDSILDGLSVERRAAFWRDTIAAETAAVASGTGTAAAVAAPARTWVVEHDGAVRGFASTGAVRDQPDGLAGAGEVFAIYLAPEARGRGLGRVLFAHVVDDLRARAFDAIVVWVFEANADARRFYEAAGFRPDGARQPVDFGEVARSEIRYRLG
jgi:ribosomal protein S18 acetylase RimI-like enzyme